MRQRQLFHALRDGELVHVDSLKDKSCNLLCPNCKKPVVAKQGEEKIWHFAHKEANCGYSTFADDGKNQQLAGFVEKTLDSIEVPSDPTYFMCIHCKQKERKELGIKWNDTEYVCKNCFRLNLS